MRNEKMKTMIHTHIIKKFNSIFREIETVQSAIIIGSFGRKNPNPNSDIDYQLLISKSFSNGWFLEKVKTAFAEEFKYSIFLDEKKKWCFYLTEELIVTEIFLCEELQHIDKYYLGSDIRNHHDAIIFDKTNKVFPYLDEITQTKNARFSETQKNKVYYLITEFQNRFEACSAAHAKSDGYKFNILFSHGLNAVVRLIYLCEGKSKHDFMPPNFLTDYSYRLGLEIEELGTMDLRVANSHKRKLLDLFLKYLPIATEKFNIDSDILSIKFFLESIYKRDSLWNFRDVAKFNRKIKRGVIYRSSALCLYKGDLDNIIDKYNIKTIIDLRANRELKDCDYSDEQKANFNITHAPFDPWAQSVEFQNTYNKGTNVEIAYKFFSLECKMSIKLIIETIINSNNAVNIHCHAGKDRTGITITLLHLLSKADEDVIHLDYLASEMDTDINYLMILFNVISDCGGIEKYLNTCQITDEQILMLKEKILA